MKRFLKAARVRFYFIAVFYFILCLLNPAQSLAASGHAGEYEVKALYLYNFTRFVQWPSQSFETPNDPIHLCIIGRDPFGKALDLLKDKTVRGRTFEIKYLKEWEDVPPDCHILYVGATVRGHFNRIIQQAQKSPTLTVSEQERFAFDGGVIGLYTNKQKVRFRINLSAAHRADLRISSNLLKLAEVIEE